MQAILRDAGGDGASSGELPVSAGRAANDLSNGARFQAGDRVIVARVWSRPEWDALPAECRPANARPTPDGRHVVALDVAAE